MVNYPFKHRHLAMCQMPSFFCTTHTQIHLQFPDPQVSHSYIHIYTPSFHVLSTQHPPLSSNYIRGQNWAPGYHPLLDNSSVFFDLISASIDHVVLCPYVIMLKSQACNFKLYNNSTSVWYITSLCNQSLQRVWQWCWRKHPHLLLPPRWLLPRSALQNPWKTDISCRTVQQWRI